MSEHPTWLQLTADDPGHSHAYVQRFRRLAEQGQDLVGVDIDPVLIATARADHPDAHWIVGDLAELDLPAVGVSEPFDAIVCAGNVMAFVERDARVEVLRRFAAHLRPDGRAAVGYGGGRGYPFDAFLTDAAAAGLVPDLLLSSWHLHPFTEDSDFLVAVLRHA
jgi:SAM-dependent methyltransferase